MGVHIYLGLKKEPSLSKIDSKDAHVKFCFHKIQVSLDLGIKTEPTLPIKMCGLAPGAK